MLVRSHFYIKYVRQAYVSCVNVREADGEESQVSIRQIKSLFLLIFSLLRSPFSGEGSNKLHYILRVQVGFP